MTQVTYMRQFLQHFQLPVKRDLSFLNTRVADQAEYLDSDGKAEVRFDCFVDRTKCSSSETIAELLDIVGTGLLHYLHFVDDPQG